MNKLKNLFLVTICIVLIGGALKMSASAQTGGSEILVVGKQPLTRSDIQGIVNFYEWAFETVFTPDEYMRFQAISIEAYRQDVATSRKNTDVLISGFAKVRGKTQAEQDEVRRSFNEAFLKELRAGNDETSSLLLGIYERSRGVSNNGERTSEVLPSEEDLREAETPAPSKSRAGSSKLVGSWSRSTGAGGSRSITNKTEYNSGTNTSFEFYADGTMLFVVKTETLSITQCRISETTKIPGTYSATGNQLTMNLGAGTSIGKSSCEAKGNFSKNLTASTITKTFVVKNLESVFRPDAPLILCFDGQDDNSCFERSGK